MKKILLILIIIPLVLGLDCGSKEEWLSPSGSITDLTKAKNALGFDLLNYDNVKIDCEKETISHGDTTLDLKDFELPKNLKVKPLPENGFELTGDFKRKTSNVEFNCKNKCKLINDEINKIPVDALSNGNIEFIEGGEFNSQNIKIFGREIGGSKLSYEPVSYDNKKYLIKSFNSIKIDQRYNFNPLNDKKILVEVEKFKEITASPADEELKFSNAIVEVSGEQLNTLIKGSGKIMYNLNSNLLRQIEINKEGEIITPNIYLKAEKGTMALLTNSYITDKMITRASIMGAENGVFSINNNFFEIIETNEGKKPFLIGVTGLGFEENVEVDLVPSGIMKNDPTFGFLNFDREGFSYRPYDPKTDSAIYILKKSAEDLKKDLERIGGKISEYERASTIKGVIMNINDQEFIAIRDDLLRLMRIGVIPSTSIPR